MPPKKRKVNKRKKNRHLIFILIFIVLGVLFLFEEFGREDLHKTFFRIFAPAEKEEKKPGPPPPVTTPKILPRVSIVIDDLGPNKRMAMGILVINAPLTLSILPQEVYSAWIAEEGYKLGRDVIMHVPMEATRPLKLGKGGLYTWMTDEEIANVMDKNVNSIPHIIGVSSHMGSAFTKDQRVMHAVISELKKKQLFFLDSVTSPRTVGYKTAKELGLKAYKRDVFLDDSNDPEDIAVQWNRLVRIARSKGYALALGHARKNTIEFLEETLKNNSEVLVVPLTKLMN